MGKKFISNQHAKFCLHFAFAVVCLLEVLFIYFIFQPRIFDAHLCRGRCPPRFNMANDHAMLQSIMHLKTRHQIHGKIPKPCCVGRKFRPLDILHVDDLDPTKLKVTRWKDVIVTECGCI